LQLQAAISKMSDVQLLEQLCSTVDDQHHYDHFVKRFLPDVQAHCDRICIVRKLDNHVGLQIAHETFERVRKYKSYSRDGSKVPDDRKAILGYLKRISTRLFNNHYNNGKKKDIVHKSYLDDIMETVSATVDVKALKNKKDVAVIIYGKLNKKEQAVVLKDIEYKKHQKYLPDDVTATLAAELKVLPGTIRKIRARAIEKIKNAINEVNKN
jgi:DNA-directed RNA polymerase specialized sigma24 family protein